MIIKFIDTLINVNEIKYVKCERQAYGSTERSITVRFKDGELLRFSTSYEDYKQLQERILKASIVK